MKKFSLALLPLLLHSTIVSAEPAKPSHAPKHFDKIMIVMFENMSYAEIKAEPTFHKLVEYSGQTLDENGRLLKMLKPGAAFDTTGNGYAFFSQYYNNHSGGLEPTRPSQPNYIAMTSGSIQGVKDNESYNLDVDNLAMELKDAKLSWKVFAEDLPDPKATSLTASNSASKKKTPPAPFVRDPNKSEAENDRAEEAYNAEYNPGKSPDYHAKSGCFIGKSNHDGPGADTDGYMRKHEPFISYKNIQSNYSYCKNIMNASHLVESLDNMPEVSLFIPNQIDDGHNGELEDRTRNANAFLSKMMGTDPKTGEPLPDAANAPFQRFMANGGLLVLTFDEPSVTNNPDRTIYTILAGNMIKSGSYPDASGKQMPVCYPAAAKKAGYAQNQCNHYNLLKMIEANWNLRGLVKKNTSAGYQVSYTLDNAIPELWRK